MPGYIRRPQLPIGQRRTIDEPSVVPFVEAGIRTRPLYIDGVTHTVEGAGEPFHRLPDLMHRVITAEDALLRRMLDIGVVTPPDHTVKARRVVDGIYIDDKIRDYIVDLTFAAREPGAFDVAIAGRIQYGASPRRMQGTLRWTPCDIESS